jgi:uncharacterized membrane protein (UPF0136 family)
MTMGRFSLIECGMFELTRIYLFIFGILTIGGGAMGFVKAGSRASLIAGGISGLLLLLAGWLMATKPQAGVILGLVISLALAGRFAPAFLKTYAVMPAGLMTLCSIIGVVLTVLCLVKGR